MKKLTIWLLVMFVLVFFAYGLDECSSEIDVGASCTITTPLISCSTYDLYNSSDDLAVDDGGMSEIGSSSVYNFTFSQSVAGRYVILLCSNDTSSINVVAVSDSTQIDRIENNVTAVSQYKADVSGLATTSQLEQNTSAIISRGDSAWITATGFSTHSAADVWSVVTRTLTAFSFGVDLNSSLTSDLASVLADTDEIQGNQSNFVTADVSSLATTAELSQNTSAILTEGGSSWTTASGFATTGNVSTLNSILKVIENGVSTNATWVTQNVNTSGLVATVNSSAVAQALWEYNITTFNVTGDLDSAGSYLKAIEVFYYG